MSALPPIIPSGGLTPATLASMDLETALMAVQSDRANRLEDQLRSQMDQMQLKNNAIAALNIVMADVNAWESNFGPSAKPTDKLPSAPTDAQAAAFEQDILNAGLNVSDLLGIAPPNPAPNPLVYLTGAELAGVTKATFDAAVTTTKSNIDNMSTTQQMDMLRLQSFSNKYNEAYDTMTDFIKKMQDSRSGILRNLN